MTKQKDSSWQSVAGWYKDVPRKKDSLHQELIIPALARIIEKYSFKGAKLMDFACGEGTVTKALDTLGFKTQGFDLAEDLIESARETFPELEFSVADAQALTPEQHRTWKAQFDGVFSVLALQNIPNLKASFANATHILKKGGVFVMVLNHPAFRIPKASAWGFRGRHKQYRIIERYMSTEKIEIKAHPGIPEDETTTVSFHRPISAFTAALRSAGLVIMDIEEWCSPKQSEAGPRAAAENQARKEFPLFMTIVTKKL